jgi:hypothetical protein
MSSTGLCETQGQPVKSFMAAAAAAVSVKGRLAGNELMGGVETSPSQEGR